MPEDLLEEIKRKLGRIIVGTLLIIIGIYVKNRYGLEVLRNAALFVFLTALLLDWLRVDFELSVPIYDWFLKRPSERQGIHGTTLGGIGCLLAVTFFDFDIALAAAAMYLYGDTFAGIVGKAFGKTKLYNGKSLEGSLAMLAITLIVGFFFLNNISLIVAMAIFATLIEIFVSHLPDDLVLPIFTALAGQFLSARPFISGFTIAIITWFIMIAALTVFIGLIVLYQKLRRQ